MADDHCSQQSQTLSPERPILVSPLNSSLLSEGRRAMAPSSAPHEGVPVGQELNSEEIKDALISFLPSFSNLMISIQHYSEDTISAQWKKMNYAEEDQESWIRVLANFLCSFKAIERIIYRLDNVEKNKELLRRSFRSELRIRAVWIAFRVSCVLVDFMVYMRGKEHLIEELKRKLNRTVKENPTSSRVAKRFLSIIKLSEKVLSTVKIDSVAVKTEELDQMGSMLIETVKDLDDVISWKQERMRMDVKLISSLQNLMQLTKRLHKHHKAVEAIVDEVWKDYYDFFNKKLDGEDEYEADSDLAEELQIPCNTVTLGSSICCSNCGRCRPKDKTIRRFVVRSVVEQAVEVQYCISCAIHSHLMRIRYRNDSRKHEPPQRMGDQAPPPAGVAAPGQAPPPAACV